MSQYLLLIVNKGPRLTNGQVKTLIDICVGTGMVCFGSVVLPFFFDRLSFTVLILGLIAVIGSWAIAISLSARIE